MRTESGAMLSLLVASATALAPPAIPLPMGLLKGTNLGGKQLARCYKASADGWSALDFHRQCDELGSIILVGQLTSGELVGGYNPRGWESIDDYRATPRAFLFCARTGSDEPQWEQSAVLGPGDIAIFDNARGGPQFGAADLVFGSPLSPVMGGFAGPDTMDDVRTAGDLRTVTSQLGGSYAKLGKAGLPCGELVELECYCNAAIDDFRVASWNPARSTRVSKAPELILDAEGGVSALPPEPEQLEDLPGLELPKLPELPKMPELPNPFGGGFPKVPEMPKMPKELPKMPELPKLPKLPNPFGD